MVSGAGRTDTDGSCDGNVYCASPRRSGHRDLRVVVAVQNCRGGRSEAHCGHPREPAAINGYPGSAELRATVRVETIHSGLSGTDIREDVGASSRTRAGPYGHPDVDRPNRACRTRCIYVRVRRYEEALGWGGSKFDCRGACKAHAIDVETGAPCGGSALGRYTVHLQARRSRSAVHELVGGRGCAGSSGGGHGDVHGYSAGRAGRRRERVSERSTARGEVGAEIDRRQAGESAASEVNGCCPGGRAGGWAGTCDG